MAFAFLKAQSVQAENSQNLSLAQDLMEHANIWQKRVVLIINTFFSDYPSYGTKILTYKDPFWNRISIWSIADSVESFELISSTSSQVLLEVLWKYPFHPNTSHLRIIFSIFCPFLLKRVLKLAYPTLKDRKEQHSSLIDQKYNHVLKEYRIFRENEDYEETFDCGCLCTSFVEGVSSVSYFVNFLRVPITKFWCHTVSKEKNKK